MCNKIIVCRKEVDDLLIEFGLKEDLIKNYKLQNPGDPEMFEFNLKHQNLDAGLVINYALVWSKTSEGYRYWEIKSMELNKVVNKRRKLIFS